MSFFFSKQKTSYEWGIRDWSSDVCSSDLTLAVCNGGIRTHPDFPRAKLNLATMRPSLAYIDRHKGRLIAEARWPDDRHQLSIRHLDVATDGTVAFGMQYKGPKGDAMPLVAMHRGAGALVPLAMPEAGRIEI